MEPERTLLQQIRDKEQELGTKIETAKAEAEAIVTAARNEAADLLCTAEKMAATRAEQVYWKEKGQTETEAESLRKAAGLEMEMLTLQGERNLPAAAREIVRYVKGE